MHGSARWYLEKKSMSLPLAIHSGKLQESDEGMPHQCHSTSLRRSVEESNLDLALLQLICKMHRRFPRIPVYSPLIVVEFGKMKFTIAVYSDYIAALDLWARKVAWAESPVELSATISEVIKLGEELT